MHTKVIGPVKKLTANRKPPLNFPKLRQKTTMKYSRGSKYLQATFSIKMYEEEDEKTIWLINVFKVFDEKSL